jgi:hypothetical protein
MSLHQEIHARCDAFAADITSLLQSSLLDLLGAGRPKAQAAPVSLASVTKGTKRSPEAIAETVEGLLECVRGFGARGGRIEEIGAAMDVPTRDLVLPMRKLLGARRVRTTGQKRATTYHAR